MEEEKKKKLEEERDRKRKEEKEKAAKLEKELEISDYHSKTKKEKRLDFSKEGNEWSAISKYKQKILKKYFLLLN